MISVFYLHGFASSPRGTKVTALRKMLEPEGFIFSTPDLNVPSFAKLSYEKMVRQAQEEGRKAEPRVIVGSSMGALVALDLVRRGLHAPLVLIAPALGVADQWVSKIAPGDPVRVFNSAEEQETWIHRAFFTEMSFVRPDAEPPPVPVRVVMGRLDESVPFDRVAGVWERWQEKGLQPGSKFVEVPEGDHSLTAHLDMIAEQIRAAAKG